MITRCKNCGANRNPHTYCNYCGDDKERYLKSLEDMAFINKVYLNTWVGPKQRDEVTALLNMPKPRTPRLPEPKEKKHYLSRFLLLLVRLLVGGPAIAVIIFIVYIFVLVGIWLFLSLLHLLST